MADDVDSFDPELDGAMFDLRRALVPHVRSPGTDAARRTVRHRRTVRQTIGAALVLTVVGGVSTMAIADRREPLVLTSPAAVRDVRAVDWSNAIVPVPGFGWCGSAEVTFRDGRGTALADGRTVPHEWVVGAATEGGMQKPAFADVDGDSRADALVRIDCVGEESGVVAYRAGPEGLQVIGVVFVSRFYNGQWPGSVTVRDGVVSVAVTPGRGEAAPLPVKWNGERFVHADRSKAILDVLDARTAWQYIHEVPAMPGCPARSRLFAAQGTSSDGQTWSVQRPSEREVVGDVTGDRMAELLVTISCTSSDPATPDGGVVVAVLTLGGDGKPVLLGTLAAQPAGRLERVEIEEGLVYVTVAGESGGPAHAYRWDGAKFVNGG